MSEIWAYEVLICMCWCTYLCIFIVIVYIYIRYTIVMSCIGVYEFFFHSVHLSLKHDVHEAELKYRKRMYLVQYFQIVRQHNRNTVEKIQLLWQLPLNHELNTKYSSTN